MRPRYWRRSGLASQIACRIARLSLSQQEFPLSGVEIDASFRERDTYQQGHLTDAPDFHLYDQLLDEQEDSDG